MKSISHLGTGWHWHSWHATWWLMAKLYDPIAAEWQSAVRGQLSFTLQCVYELCGRRMFPNLISLFCQITNRMHSGFVYLDRWPCVYPGPCLRVPQGTVYLPVQLTGTNAWLSLYRKHTHKYKQMQCVRVSCQANLQPTCPRLRLKRLSEFI